MKSLYQIHQFLTFITLTAFILCALLAPMNAQAIVGGGEGTASNPYLIETFEHLQEFKSYVDNSNDSYISDIKFL